MIGEDIALAGELYRLVADREELEPLTHSLSITTFRFVPAHLELQKGSSEVENYLNEVNQELLTRLERSGEAFLSNAVVEEKCVLRACIVNFRTSVEDLEALVEIVVRLGRQVDVDLRRRLSVAVSGHQSLG
jgi:glutamate/tyrosine decarboxylase-like PLP-dependent enzyme